MKCLALILVLFTFVQIPVQAQKKEYIYAQIVGTEKFFSTKVRVSIDFGQETKFFGDRGTIRDKDGKRRSFNSMIDALNFMGSIGWEFAQAYTITLSNQNVYHYLLKKEATKEELEELRQITKKPLIIEEGDEDTPIVTNSKPETPKVGKSIDIQAKGSQISFAFGDKSCVKKNAKIKVWFENAETILVDNVSENNCTGTASFVLSADNLKKAKTLKISVLQINTEQGVTTLLIGNKDAVISELNK